MVAVTKPEFKMTERLCWKLSTLAQCSELPPVLNLATPGTVHMGDLLDAAGLAWTSRPANGETIAKVALDTTRISQFIDWTPADSTPHRMVQEWHEVTNRL